MRLERDHRVAILGGGPAGAVAALTLARYGVQVTVLEKNHGPVEKLGESLPPSAQPLLHRLQLDQVLLDDEHLTSQGNRFIWGTDEVSERHFLSTTDGEGWHIDRRSFEAFLAAAARAAGVDWRWGHRFEHCKRVDGKFRLTVSWSPKAPDEPWGDGADAERSTRVFDVDFLADASGRRARLARRVFGIQRQRYDRLVGTAGHFVSDTPALDTFTLVEAVPDGWWYSALLADGRMVVAYMSDGDLLRTHSMTGQGGWGRDAFRGQLENAVATRDRLESHGYTQVGDVRRLPAESSVLETIVGDGWIALGDAAAAYDPLSSHGIVAAMGSGYYGARSIAGQLAGLPEAREAYLSVMQGAYNTYLDLQREHYGLEQRFADRPFWGRRHRPEFCLEPLRSKGRRRTPVGDQTV